LAAIQHKYFRLVVTSMHVHLEHHHDMEVLLVQGPAEQLQALADELVTVRCVKQGKLSLTATALPPLLRTRLSFGFRPRRG
jgi:CopG family nickel-responsive transcriptional regulator